MKRFVTWMKDWIVWFWNIISRPSAYLSLGFLTLGGFVCGVLFWGAFNTALELTNTEKFCISCHEMHDNVYQELQRTIHFTNRSGVRATCPDCHVPHNWTDKIARKMQASKEVWGKIFGTISTRQKFLDMRLELAKHEWSRLKANDSLECRNCHSAVAMDFTKQTRRAAEIHSRYLVSGERTCIDCHKGIAHELPDMTGIEPGWRAPPELGGGEHSSWQDDRAAILVYLEKCGLANDAQAGRSPSLSKMRSAAPSRSSYWPFRNVHINVANPANPRANAIGTR